MTLTMLQSELMTLHLHTIIISDVLETIRRSIVANTYSTARLLKDYTGTNTFLHYRVTIIINENYNAQISKALGNTDNVYYGFQNVSERM